MVAVLLVTSVLVVFLLLLGCFGFLWYIYKKAKYTFHSGTSLPQHLKEFLGHPHHRASPLFSLPLSDETEVFDKLSVINEETEGSEQGPGDSCAPGTPCKLGCQELGSRSKAPSPAHGDPLLLTSASEV
ncbi:interleukin 10 receptor beta [Cricetulus griseus]